MKTAPKYRKCEQLDVGIYPDRASMGVAAAEKVATYLNDVVARQGQARVIFACAPSQDDFLAALIRLPVPWESIEAFHMDEYVGLKADDPQSFRHYLNEHLLRHIKPRAFHPIMAEASDLQRECSRYAVMLQLAPIDLICMGVGENGHIAFNDPPVADFEDPLLIKRVTLDEACRNQQVHDGCFPAIESVPREALSLTVPVFLTAQKLSIVVPGHLKSEAVKNMLEGPVTTSCPASILRKHPDALLFLDEESASRLS